METIDDTQHDGATDGVNPPLAEPQAQDPAARFAELARQRAQSAPSLDPAARFEALRQARMGKGGSMGGASSVPPPPNYSGAPPSSDTGDIDLRDHTGQEDDPSYVAALARAHAHAPVPVAPAAPVPRGVTPIPRGVTAPTIPAVPRAVADVTRTPASPTTRGVPLQGAEKLASDVFSTAASAYEHPVETGVNMISAPVRTGLTAGTFLQQKANDGVFGAAPTSKGEDASGVVVDHQNDNDLMAAAGVPHLTDREGALSAAQLAALGFGDLAGKLAGKVTAQMIDGAMTKLGGAEVLSKAPDAVQRFLGAIAEMNPSLASDIGQTVSHATHGATIGGAYGGVPGAILGGLGGVALNEAAGAERRAAAEPKTRTFDASKPAPPEPDFDLEPTNPYDPEFANQKRLPSGELGTPVGQPARPAAAPPAPEVPRPAAPVPEDISPAQAKRVEVLDYEIQRLEQRAEQEPFNNLWRTQLEPLYQERATIANAGAVRQFEALKAKRAGNEAGNVAPPVAPEAVAAPTVAPETSAPRVARGFRLPGDEAPAAAPPQLAEVDRAITSLRQELSQSTDPDVQGELGSRLNMLEAQGRKLRGEPEPDVATAAAARAAKAAGVRSIDQQEPLAHRIGRAFADVQDKLSSTENAEDADITHEEDALQKLRDERRQQIGAAAEAKEFDHISDTYYDELAKFAGRRGVEGRPLGTPRTPPTPLNRPTAPAVQGDVPPGGVTIKRMAVKDIIPDPQRFQYKAHNDKESGVTGELKSVKKFDESLAGVISVWRDPATGIVHPINGHHRLELAARANHPSLNVQELDAKTPQEARAMGAVANIAEGRGTALDAARFFRESGQTPESLQDRVSVKGAIMRHGASLSKLAPDVFARVERGDLSEGHGSAIGEMLSDPAQQRVAAKLLDGKRASDQEARELARQIRDAGSEATTEESLFGAQAVESPLFLEKAQLATLVKRRLASDKKLFGFVAKGNRAEALARGGNVIDAKRSGEIADQAGQLEEVFNQLYTRSGPVSDALTAAARQLKNGAKPQAVLESIYPVVHAAIHEVVGRGAGAGGAAPRDTGATQPVAAGGGGGDADAEGRVGDSHDPGQNAMFERSPEYKKSTPAEVRKQAIAERMSELGDLSRPVQYDVGHRSPVIAHRNTRVPLWEGAPPAQPYRITHLDGEHVAGHDEFDTVEDVAKELVRRGAKLIRGTVQDEKGRFYEQSPSYGGKEHIVKASVMLPDGTVHTGQTHLQAWESAKFPEGMDPERAEGFVTSMGRHVSRDEATAIAERAGQIKYGADVGEGVAAEDIVGLGRNSVREDAPRYAEKSPLLSGLHNLSPQNLAAADKLGGFPAPSLAVVPEKHPFDQYGSITLIAKASAFDPSRVPVFDVDAYSGRAPRPDFRPLPWKQIEKLTAPWKATFERIGDSSAFSELRYHLYDQEDAQRAADKFVRSEGAKALFLEQKGIPFETPDMAVPLSTGSVAHTPIMQAFIKKHDIDINARPHEEYWKLFSQAAKRAGMDKRAFDEDGLLHFGVGNRMLYDFEKVGTRRPDQYQIRENIERAIKPLQEEYEEWAETQMQPFLAEPFLKVGRTKRPYSLKSATEASLNARIVGAEETMTHGPGKARAGASTRFRDIEHARNAATAPWGIRHPDEVKALTDAFEQETRAWRDAMIPYYEHEDTWDALDSMHKALESYMKKNPVPDARLTTMRAALRGAGFRNVPKELLEQSVEQAKQIREMPADYFEAKPQRAVTFDEFAGAVVPDSLPKRYRAILERRGIPMREYPADDHKVRAQVLDDFRRELHGAGHDVLRETSPEYSGTLVRTKGIPADVPHITSMQYESTKYKTADFAPAKAGDVEAAVRFVEHHVDPATVAQARKAFGADAIYTAPTAEEATGINAIPRVLAEYYAQRAGGSADDALVQSNRAFHTSADMMQRLVSPALFDGTVTHGGRYVLVDDVAMSGGTMAGLASYIQEQGGTVVGVVTLADASRTGELAPSAQVIQQLERRHGHDIRSLFGLEPAALTNSEARYLIGFRDADELRTRAATAHEAQARRLGARRVQPDDSGNARVSEPGFNLFGEEEKSDTAPSLQDSLFGADRKAGTAESRSLAETEMAARSELARLRQQVDLVKDAGHRQRFLKRIGQLEMLVNRDQAISAEEMKTRLAAITDEKPPTLEGQQTLFEKAPAYQMPPAFYSRLEKAIESGPPRATVDQWKARLSKNVAAGEREWTGIDRFLADKEGVVSRDDVLAAFKAGAISLKTVVRTKDTGRRVTDTLRWEYVEGLDKYWHAEVWDKSGTRKRNFLIVRMPNRKYRLSSAGGQDRAFDSLEAAKEDAQYWADNISARYVDVAKYANYTEPGGTNYRELAVTLDSRPGNATFRSQHFEGVENPLLHVRLKDRVLPDGRKVLHIEEIQSDWHQRGRQYGYFDPSVVGRGREGVLEWMQKNQPRGAFTDAVRRERGLEPFTEKQYTDLLEERGDGINRPESAMTAPNAPFKKTDEWVGLALKHVIDEAVRGGYDVVAWTPGEIQGQRFDIGKQVDLILYDPDTQELTAMQDGYPRINGEYAPEKLPSVVGKEIAKRLLESEKRPAADFVDEDYYDDEGMQKPVHALSGDDLIIGAAGMMHFYDELVPGVLRDYGKKIGTPITIKHIDVLSDARKTTLTADDVRSLGSAHAAYHDEFVEMAEYMEENDADWQEAFDETKDPGWREGEEQAVRRLLERAAGEDSAGAFPSFEVTPALREKVAKEGQFLYERTRAYQSRDVDQADLFSMDAPPPDEAVTAFGSQAEYEAARKRWLPLLKELEDSKIPTARQRHEQLAEHGKRQQEMDAVSLAGIKLGDKESFARLMDLFRDPHIEKMHLFVLGAEDSGGTRPLMGHFVDTVGALNFASVNLNSLLERAQGLGGEAVVFGHNHPSGDAQASEPDILLTAEAFEKFEQAGIPLLGHVIIDHGTYAWIERKSADAISVSNRLTFPALPTTYQTAADVQRASLTSSQLAGVMMQMVASGTGATLMYVDTQRRLIAVDFRMADDLRGIAEWLPEDMKQLAAHSVFIGAPLKDAKALKDRAVSTHFAAGGAANWTQDILDIFGTDPEASGQNALTRLEWMARSHVGVASRDLAKKNTPSAEIRADIRGARGTYGDRARFTRAASLNDLRESLRWHANGISEPPAPYAPGTHPMPDPAGLGERERPTLSKLARSIQRTFHPESIDERSKATAGTIRAEGAKGARELAQATEALLAFRNQVDKLSRKAAIDYWSNAEQGQSVGNPEFDAGNAELHRVTQHFTDALIQRGLLNAESAIEDYIGRFWTTPEKVDAKKKQNFLASIFSKRPLEGSKSFLKQRSLEHFTDGLDAGLIPATYNYVDSQLAKIAEMQRLITAHDELQEELTAGRAKRVMTSMGQQPPLDANGDKWVRLGDGTDAAFVIYGPRTGAVKLEPNDRADLLAAGFDENADIKRMEAHAEVFGRRVLGHWYAPKSSAAVWDAHLSRGMKSKPWVAAYMAVARAATQALLGFGGFHLTVIANEGLISELSHAVDALANHGLRPRVGLAAKSLGKGAASAVLTARLGRQVMQEFHRAGAHPELATVLSSMIEGGFRGSKSSEMWSGDRKDAMRRAWNDVFREDESIKRRLKGSAKLLGNFPLSVIEMTSSPILGAYVPWMKAGAAYTLLAQELEKLPQGASIADIRARAGDVMKEMDYRFGQVQYDNHFMNRMAKDIAQLLFLAPGWTFGTLTLAGRGARDVAVAPKRAYDAVAGGGGKGGGGGRNRVWIPNPNYGKGGKGSGKKGTWQTVPPELIGRSAAYWLAAAAVLMMMNGTITYLLTKKRPTGMDYFAFRDGTKDRDGNDNRHLIPGYITHDLWSWAHHPGRTMGNKLTPVVAFLYKLYTNRTYFGDQIYNEAGTTTEKAKQIGKATADAFTPIAAQNFSEAKKRGADSPTEIVMNVLGVNPAKREMERTPAQNKMDELLARHHFPRTPEEQTKSEGRADVVAGLRDGTLSRDDLRRLVRTGKMTASQAVDVIQAARNTEDPLIARFKRLSYDEAQSVYAVANEREKRLWTTPLRMKQMLRQLEGAAP